MHEPRIHAELAHALFDVGRGRHNRLGLQAAPQRPTDRASRFAWPRRLELLVGFRANHHRNPAASQCPDHRGRFRTETRDAHQVEVGAILTQPLRQRDQVTQRAPPEPRNVQAMYRDLAVGNVARPPGVVPGRENRRHRSRRAQPARQVRRGRFRATDQGPESAGDQHQAKSVHAGSPDMSPGSKTATYDRFRYAS